MTALPSAFDPTPLELELDRLLPTRPLPKELASSRKYAQIKASMQEVGLIEPLSVTAADRKSGLHMILDGHLRLQAARELGYQRVACLCASDDEGFTYNKRVNRLATVQEHYMILRALERGVSEERLARALNVNIASIRRKRDLLEGICPEVVEILKNQHFAGDVMRHLRKMKSGRQIECAELMASVNNYSVNYAAALLAATPAEQLCDPERPKTFRGLSAEQMARMEKEMSLVQSRFKVIEQSYGTDVLNMVLARGYVARLLGNKAVASYLRRHQPDFLDEFRAIVATKSLDEATP
jgi:hypothetical protein